ncbi:MAG: L-threonylcarbamoyladenylate synthase [Ginsengibacter sp.]
MKNEKFDDDLKSAVTIIKNGGIILYPTDTIWGVGCDATNEAAIKKIYRMKKRDEKKSMIILLAASDQIDQYVSNPSQKILEFLAFQKTPTTAIFSNAINLPENLINEDGSIAIRITKDEFCRQVILKSGVPIVSTSANISGQYYPQIFSKIGNEIKRSVDYIVRYRQEDTIAANPSSIVKLNSDGSIEKLR